MRVLHCPTDTGGHAWTLSRAERAWGVESDVMVRRSNWFQYPNDIDLHLEGRSLFGAGLRATSFLASAIRNYDVFVFNGGMSLFDLRQYHLHYLEIPLLKRMGKRIVMIFQGCDARIRGRCLAYPVSACAECHDAYGYPCNDSLDRKKRARWRKIAKYADRVFALNPDLLHDLPGAELLPYASVDLQAWAPTKARRQRDRVVILHPPSSRNVKGTRHIIEVIRRLEGKGYPIDFILMENLPHSQVKEIYQQADIMIDQLLVGWYGGAAVEAMALAKPVLCYLREEDLDRFVPFKEKIPLMSATQETLYDRLVELIEDPARRARIGEESRRYVEEVHDPIRIAERLIRVYQGKG